MQRRKDYKRIYLGNLVLAGALVFLSDMTTQENTTFGQVMNVLGFQAAAFVFQAVILPLNSLFDGFVLTNPVLSLCVLVLLVAAATAFVRSLREPSASQPQDDPAMVARP